MASTYVARPGLAPRSNCHCNSHTKPAKDDGEWPREGQRMSWRVGSGEIWGDRAPAILSPLRRGR